MAPPEETPRVDGAKEEDPEKKKKKEEKAREKEMKKLKAAQKAEAAKAQAEKASQPSKKAEQKAAKKAVADENHEDYQDPPTPLGEKKMLAQEMAKAYNPSAVEAAWYQWWEKSGFFVADANSKKPPFVIVLPPPNVTGALHIGHGLTSSIEDTIIRWRRMSGYNTLWVPGMDHAGIATQVVVEKKIMRERGLTRHDLGREQFVAEVQKWKEEYGGTILKQERRLGASLDWSRECFTMDEKRSKAVTEAFVCLYKESLIYRDHRLVNWDCVLRTAISDIEVDYIDIKGRTLLKVPGYKSPVEFGVLTSFAYPLEEGLGEIVVATTRPETMLGDTAIAVHPSDQRYMHLHKKFAVHPFNGRRLPIICDAELVDPNFGTGAVKITPAHDPNDFAVGKRHNLDFINIFTNDGMINSNGGKEFEGMKRFDARVAIIEALKSKGLYRGSENNDMRLGTCSRSEDIIEPMIKPQWFVNCSDMGREACEAVEDGRLEIIPKQYEADWFRWLRNIRDWCISRQLWWGHRVPAWYITLEDDAYTEFGFYDDHWVVGRNEEEALAEACAKFPGRKYHIEQDPDVLDTWFSSGLFPFSVMGWPEDTVDMKTFYPTTLLETGHDILFFWVARMVILGMKITGKVPFKQVYLHPMVRDAHGRKMSKSLGNVIDPLEVINGVSLEGLHGRLEQGNLDRNELEIAKAGQVKDFPNGIPECGTDALRFALVAYTAQSDKINLDIQRVVGYRHWCNKLWNAIRFAMLNLGKDFIPSEKLNVKSLPFGCKWILSALNKAIAKTVTAMEAYEFSDATSAVYSWWQYQLCDVFIEIIKPIMSADENSTSVLMKRATRDTLWICLDNGLRLLHPFMPFVTEELWQRLPQRPGDTARKESIMISDYPAVVEEWTDDEIESQMALIESTVRSIRSLRMEYKLQPKQRPESFLLCKTDEVAAILESCTTDICTLATLASLKVLRESDAPPIGCAVNIVNEHVSAFVLLRGIVDAEVELSKLNKKKEELTRQQETLSKKMNIPGYTEKVPANIQEENLDKLNKLMAEMNIIEEANANFQKLLHDGK
uniref:Valine--tRNA ligase, mitochondrial n=1 Tax=Wollemia nobilis TaxID=56998 RepID=A0A0C9S2L0_9CONI